MAIIVQEVLSGASGKWRVRLRHGDNDVIADLQIDAARSVVGQPLFVEIDIASVSAWGQSTEESQIVALPSGQHRLIGEIHDQMELDDGSFLYDLYIAPGPDYFAIDSKDIGGAKLTPGERVFVDVMGLCFVPTGT